VTAPVLGPRTLAHLEDLLPAADLELTAEQVERLGRWTAPAESYPHRMLTEQVGLDFSKARLSRR
jgi:aryl-alcohol dehydrogenase-like predicted oxidoreductase